MFENFSKGYESFFRVITIIWVCAWTFINVSQTMALYYTLYSSDKDIASQDIFRIILNWITVIVGIVMVGVMISVGNKVEKTKKIGTVALLAFLGTVYYLFYTVMNLIITVITASDARSIQKEILFNTVWIIPSLVMLVCHYFYVANIAKYNQEIPII